MPESEPNIPERFDTLALMYMSGMLSIDDMAVLLDVAHFDVSFLLDAIGLARSADVIRLDALERERICRGLRADRMQRQGEPAFDPEHAMRDAIASSRLEGIDARPWLSL